MKVSRSFRYESPVEKEGELSGSPSLKAGNQQPSLSKYLNSFVSLNIWTGRFRDYLERE